MTGPGDRGGARPPAARIAGRVVDAQGRPVAEARVMIAGDSPDHPDIAQLTGPDGSYRFGGLAPGRYTVKAIDVTEGEAAVDLGDDEEAELDIPLRPPP